MSKNEQKAKYGRIANDPSQLEMFKDDVIDGNIDMLPELPPDAEGKVLVLKWEDGEAKWEEGGAPVPPTPVIEKGSIIKLGNDEYRVLSVNEDLTDCEVMHIGPVALSKFSNASPSQDPSTGTTFIVNGEEKTGLKYEGSVLDTACEAFYDELPADIKAAIIEQEVIQDMYNTNVSEGDEDFSIDNSADGGMVYRFKKVNDESVVVGTRHAYALSCGALKKFYGTDTKRGLVVAKDFQLQSWLSDANSDDAGNACYLCYDRYYGVSVNYDYCANMYCVCPAFHIDLTKINL